MSDSTIPDVSDHFIAEYDIHSNDIRPINPKEEKIPPYTWPRNYIEQIVKYVYEDILGYMVGEIDHKRNNCMDHALRKFPDETDNHIQRILMNNINFEDGIPDRPKSDIESLGIPDFVMYNEDQNDKIQFVEVKGPGDSIRDTQKKWMSDFDFLPIKIAFVFTDKLKYDRFLNTGPETEHQI